MGFPPPHFVAFRDAQVFPQRAATPTSTESLWPSWVLWVGSWQVTRNDLLMSHVLRLKHQNSLVFGSTVPLYGQWEFFLTGCEKPATLWFCARSVAAPTHQHSARNSERRRMDGRTDY